jgi:hypothetical protein
VLEWIDSYPIDDEAPLYVVLVDTLDFVMFHKGEHLHCPQVHFDIWSGYAAAIVVLSQVTQGYKIMDIN